MNCSLFFVEFGLYCCFSGDAHRWAYRWTVWLSLNNVLSIQNEPKQLEDMSIIKSMCCLKFVIATIYIIAFFETSVAGSEHDLDFVWPLPSNRQWHSPQSLYNCFAFRSSNLAVIARFFCCIWHSHIASISSYIIWVACHFISELTLWYCTLNCGWFIDIDPKLL